MIYVDEHGYLCITELYTEKIVKRERAGKYIYDILYIPAKGVFILADDGVYEVIGILVNYGTYMDNRKLGKKY